MAIPSRKPYTQNIRKQPERANIIKISDEDDDYPILASCIECLPLQIPRYNDYQLVLDSGATAHVVKDEAILVNIRKVDAATPVRGFRGTDTTLETVGEIESIGRAYLLKDAHFNLISFSQLEADGHMIVYNMDERMFIATREGNDIEFKLEKGLFKAYISMQDKINDDTYQLTVTPNIEDITEVIPPNQALPSVSKKDIERYSMIRDLHNTLGHPCDDNLKKSLRNGGLLNCPLTAKEVDAATRYLGPCTACLKAKMTRDSPGESETPPAITFGEEIVVDIFYLTHKNGVEESKIPYLVFKDKKGLKGAVELKNKSEKVLDKAFQSIERLYATYGHRVKMYLSDNEANFRAVAELTASRGIRFNHTAPEQHASRAERLIREIKERVRALYYGVGYILPTTLMKYMVAWVIQCLNAIPNANTGNVSANELFKGSKMDYKRDLRCSFGTIGLFKTPMTPSRKDLDPRSELGIVIGREINGHGNLKVYIPSRRRIVTRNKLVITKLSDGEIRKLLDQGGGEIPEEMDEPEPELPSEEDYDLYWTEEEVVKVMNMSVQEAISCNNSLEAIEAIKDELLGMEKMNVYSYIMPTKDTQAISSKMFVKQKHDADGNATTVKARLAARGDQWYGEVDEDTSSPTVDQATINVILDIAVQEQCEILSCDIPKAYLQSMDLQKTIHMKLAKDVSEILVGIRPDLRKYMYNEQIYVKLNKPLYGLKEAGMMWYDTLKTYLNSLGYGSCTTDRCSFIKREGEKFVIICIHVDDMLIIGNSEKLVSELKKGLIKQYEVNKFEVNNISYLNMSINQSSDRATIYVSQEGYIDQLIRKFMGESCKISKTPSTKDLFHIENDATTADKPTFISCVMSLMYVAKRTRPDILKEVVYLATRCSEANIDDMNKLIRILQYLNGTRSLGIKFTKQLDNNYYVFVDASYGVHQDAKGHSGIIIQRGLDGGIIFTKSSKQKLVGKSSTENELIALFEGCKFVEWLRNLVNELGFQQLRPTIIYQDNKSTITLVEKGFGSFGKTKHINMRYFSIKDLISNKTIQLKHLSTKDMLADILTKPLVGQDFVRLRSRLVFSKDIYIQNIEKCVPPSEGIEGNHILGGQKGTSRGTRGTKRDFGPGSK
jgi:hypothetical protein